MMRKFSKLSIMTRITLSLSFILMITIAFPSNSVSAEPKKICETHTMYPLGKQRYCKNRSRRLAEKEVGERCAIGSRKTYNSQMIGSLKKTSRPAGPTIFTIDENGKRVPLILELCGATWKVCVTCQPQ